MSAPLISRSSAFPSTPKRARRVEGRARVAPATRVDDASWWSGYFDDVFEPAAPPSAALSPAVSASSRSARDRRDASPARGAISWRAFLGLAQNGDCGAFAASFLSSSMRTPGNVRAAADIGRNLGGLSGIRALGVRHMPGVAAQGAALTLVRVRARDVARRADPAPAKPRFFSRAGLLRGAFSAL